MLDLTGKQLGQYAILSQIGRGGMAVVYRAYQPSMDREVAIKVMIAHVADDESFVARFKREVRLISHLQHPYILPVYDFGSEGGYAYLVMRLVEGGSLAQRLKNAPISLEQTTQIFTQVASALGYAHSEGIIHRDVKPNNILLDKRDYPYLMDFGLARMAIEQSRISTSQMVLGTPGYMSPEQWRSEGVDQRTDIYALGVTLYEMLTGNLPFVAETPHGLMYKHLNEPPPSPRDFNLAVPPAIVPVLNKALAKNKSDRYESAEAFAAAVNEAMEQPSERIQLGPELPIFQTFAPGSAVDSQVQPPAKTRSRPFAVLVVLIGIVAFAIGIGGVLLTNRGAGTPVTNTSLPAIAAVLPTNTPSATTSATWTATSIPPSPLIAPSITPTVTTLSSPTPIPPTQTPLATNTPRPTFTPLPTATPTWTATATDTPIPPTFTPTDTASPSPSPTDIPNIPLISRDYVDIISVSPPLVDGLLLNQEKTFSVTVRYKVVTQGEVKLSIWLQRFQDANCTQWFVTEDGYVNGSEQLLSRQKPTGTVTITFAAKPAAGPYAAILVDLEQGGKTLAADYANQRGCYKIDAKDARSTPLPLDMLSQKDYVYIYSFYNNKSSGSGSTIGYKISTPGTFTLRAYFVRFSDEACTSIKMSSERTGEPEAKIMESISAITVTGVSSTGTGGFGLTFPALSQKVLDAPAVMVYADILEPKTGQILATTNRFCIPTTLLIPAP